MKRQIDEIASWWYGKLMKWQVDENGKLMEWQMGKNYVDERNSGLKKQVDKKASW
jgi:hypothetical protein